MPPIAGGSGNAGPPGTGSSSPGGSPGSGGTAGSLGAAKGAVTGLAIAGLVAGGILYARQPDAPAPVQADVPPRVESATSPPPVELPASRAVAVVVVDAGAVPSPAVPEPPHRPVERTVPSNAEPAPSQPAPATEHELIRLAWAALATNDADDALALIEQHAERFPTGALTEEREAIRIRAFLARGDGDRARSLILVFGEDFPNSIHLRALEAELEKAQ